jgi:hypothetical protein
MKTIMLEMSDEQFAHLTQAAEFRYASLSELLKARLIDLLEDPTDPFDPRWQLQSEREEEFLRRIA